MQPCLNAFTANTKECMLRNLDLRFLLSFWYVFFLKILKLEENSRSAILFQLQNLEKKFQLGGKN